VAKEEKTSDEKIRRIEDQSNEGGEEEAQQ